MAIPLRDSLVSQVRTTLYLLMGAVALVLLIACANVANLMLARGTVRAREIAVRAALGASRHQIIRHLLAESLVLGLIACGLGLLLAYGGMIALLRFGAPYVPLPRLNDIQMDWRVLAFSVGISLLTTLTFGLAPAIQAARASVKDAMNQGGTRGALGGTASATRNGLVVAQIALSCTLAINAGLLFRSFVLLTEAPLGFESSGILVMYAHAPARGSIFDTSGVDNYLRAGRFFDDVLARLRQLPNVIAAGGAMGLPTGHTIRMAPTRSKASTPSAATSGGCHLPAFVWRVQGISTRWAFLWWMAATSTTATSTTGPSSPSSADRSPGRHSAMRIHWDTESCAAWTSRTNG